MTGIKNYRTTPSLNGNVLATGSAVEGMPPSAVNDSLRQMMSDTKDWYLNAEWIEFGNGQTAITPVRVSGTQITINADVTTAYHAGRRIKLVDGTGTTLYGTITISSYGSPNTTITIGWDSGSIGSGTITSTMLGITSAINTSAPTNIPVGGVIIWTQSVLPNGFLLADGSLVNKVDYPALFNALGNNFGTSTSTQFYLPNLADKFVIGKGSTYSTLGATGGTSTLTPSGTNSTPTFSGSSFTPSGIVTVSGSASGHALTEAEIPNHYHYVLHNDNMTTNSVNNFSTAQKEFAIARGNNGGMGSSDTHIQTTNSSSLIADAGRSSTVGSGSAHSHSLSASGSFSGTATTPSGSVSAPSFTGNSASIINPYIAMSYIIKS